MEIRPLRQADDRKLVSRIYEQSWKYAYRGIIPQRYLDGIPAGRWAERLDEPGRSTLVMLRGGVMIGTCSYGSARLTEFAGFGEIVSIYLLPEYMGKGYGGPLLRAAVERLGQAGFDDIYLWVLEENWRARRFYEKAGFALTAHFLEVSIGGKPLREIQYQYHLK